MIFAQKTIEDFLYTPGKFFEIPEFQRPYSWQTSNIAEFLSDLEECVTKQKNHYFGTVVFVRETDNIDSSAIIDGQQRVTTALLMISAIYHLVLQDPTLSTLPAEVIKEKYLVNAHAPDDQKNRVKLRTVTSDNMILQRIFDESGDASKLTTEEKQSKVFVAYSEFRDYFGAKTDLHKYISGLSHFEIVTIALDSRDDNPQRVFESINSTGIPLTDGDKIRNFALMLNRDTDRRHVYERYWKHIERSLTDANKDFITDFFRQFLISKRQSIIRYDGVYPEFKKLFEKSITNEQAREDIDVFYADIVRVLEYYAVCKFGADANDRFGMVADVTFKMRYLQTDLYIPFAMSVMGYYDEGKISESELADVFRLIEVYFSRRVVCNIPTTGSERMMASLHKDIRQYQSESPEAGYVDIMKYSLLNRSGNTRMPSDSEFIDAISFNHTYLQRTAHVNYILASVDDQSKESHLLRQIATRQLRLSIEHVMPQTLTAQWRADLGEMAEQVHEKYLHTLANLTLTGYNSEYSNRSFEEKKTIPNGFYDSPLKMNKMIADAGQWNDVELKKRQKWWITNLKKVWPLPQAAFTPPVVDETTSLLDQDDLKGRGIRALYIFDDIIPVTTWSQAMDYIAERVYDVNPDFYAKVLQDDLLSLYIKTDSSGFYSAAEIYDTNIFIETAMDTNRKLRVIRALGDVFELQSSDIRAEIVSPKAVSEE